MNGWPQVASGAGTTRAQCCCGPHPLSCYYLFHESEPELVFLFVWLFVWFVFWMCLFLEFVFHFFYFSHHLPNGGSSFSINDAPRLTTSTSPHPHHLLFSLLPRHAWIRRQFYTFRTSYLGQTSPNRGDYESVPFVDTSTVLHFQHFILIKIIIKITDSSTVLHFQHFILTSY